MGRNVAQLDDPSCDLLQLVDGETPWSSILTQYARQARLPVEQGKQQATEIASKLLEGDFVLVRSATQSQ